MDSPTSTRNQEQERILIWADIRHLHKSCGEQEWYSEEMMADPAWREMQRLIRIAASHKWTMTEP